ncbi:MAG: hypothetical protein JWO36_3250 [Myxococcales bacterium]|nr:hypothetical protein [Myxococcales bacterium]
MLRSESVHRWVALLLLLGCEAPATPAAAPPPRVLYPAALPPFPIGVVTARIGRSQAPQLVVSQDLDGEPRIPLHLPTSWQVPGDGVARAILYGLEGDTPAIELVDIDGGKIIWRDKTACGAPIVGVTTQVIVCADAHGTRAVGLDGKPRWHNDATFIAMSDDRVVIGGAGESVILDAATGDELARVKLPPGVTSDEIIASCGDAGRELFAALQDGKLARIAEAKGGPKITWSVPVGNLAGIDACVGTTVLVTASIEAGTALLSIARDTGKLAGRVDGVRGYWPARNGTDHLEIATATEVARYPRELSIGTPIALPLLGELLAKRGDQRLVRATAQTAALLDRDGVRAYVPLSAMGAALGDRSIVTASWRGSPAETVHRFAIPEPWNRMLRARPRRPPLAVPAELRDLPEAVALDVSAATPRPETAMHAVAAVALDPIDSHLLYTVTLEHPPDDANGAGLASYDLAGRTWGWARADGCGLGTPVAVSVAREVIVCAARGTKSSSVRATKRDGSKSWEFVHGNIDAIEAGADVVVVHDADRLLVLDAAAGTLLGSFTSVDGAPVRAAALDIAGMAIVVTAEQGRVLARLPRVAMVPAWTIAVDGVVRALSASGDGVLVELDDGDAYRIDARTGIATAIPGLDLRWRATGDLIAGEAAGGPIPPDKMPAIPPPPVRRGPVPPRDPDAAPFSRPWVVTGPLLDSWQYTLYDLAGGLRARNDYALSPPIWAAAERGGGDSALLVESGPGLRDVLVIDPRRGDPVRRARLPDDAPSGLAFATVVDGKPVVGVILAGPLRVALF